MTLRERVPKPLRSPVGLLSLGVMIVGVAIGYILVWVGITLYFDLNALDTTSAGPVTNTESLIVLAVGLVAGVIGYFGWRGFMYFSY